MKKEALQMSGCRAAVVAFFAACAIGESSAELLGRDIYGVPVGVNDASAVFIYDSTLDVTWLRDWDYIHRSGALSPSRNYVTWEEADRWATELSVGDFTGWRLPKAKRGCGYSGWLCLDTEMGHIYFSELGNGSGGLMNAGPFLNAKREAYWLEDLADGDSAFLFSTSGGHQFSQSRYLIGGAAIAVRSGDVVPVPEPTIAMMLLGGLVVMIFSQRRRYFSQNSPRDVLGC